jgi:hypothetical protein
MAVSDALLSRLSLAFGLALVSGFLAVNNEVTQPYMVSETSTLPNSST